jgi:hypothetical protein
MNEILEILDGQMLSWRFLTEGGIRLDPLIIGDGAQELTNASVYGSESEGLGAKNISISIVSGWCLKYEYTKQ